MPTTHAPAPNASARTPNAAFTRHPPRSAARERCCRGDLYLRRGVLLAMLNHYAV